MYTYIEGHSSLPKRSTNIRVVCSIKRVNLKLRPENNQKLRMFDPMLADVSSFRKLRKP